MINSATQLKTSGLQFARAFQIAIKSATVFPVEHKSSERPIQQSFDFLAGLTKSAGQFTFGFVDTQVMLNNLLTIDPSLKPLEHEFSKRGIAAITFESGLAFAAYKKLVYLFAAPPAAMERAGGFIPFCEQNPIERLRILAARKPKKNEQGDTIIESDSESYIRARQSGEEQAPHDFLDSIEALLESGCFDPTARAQALAEFAVGTDTSGYGVPIDVPKLVAVKDGEVVVPASAVLPNRSHVAGSSSPHGGTAGFSSDATLSSARGIGTGMGTAVGPARVHGTVISGSVGTGNLTANTVPVGTKRSAALPARSVASGGGDGPDTFLQLVEASVQRSLAEEKGSPEKSLLSLARVLRNTGVERILERFPVEERENLRTLNPEQVAAEYVEDIALQLAGEKLKRVETTTGVLVEEEAIQLLSRSVRATHTAERLAQKLAKFIQEFAVPPHVQEKIREELQWTSFPPGKKYSRLLEIQRYNNLEFRRFMEVAKDLLKDGDLDRISNLVNHYFEFLDGPEIRIESAELSRVPEMVDALAPAYAGFSPKTTERLSRVLLRDGISEFIHFQAANGLATLGQTLAAHEEFEKVTAVGAALEKSLHRDLNRHTKCCVLALGSLVPPAAVERIVELYLTKRGDSVWARTAASLLRFAAPGSIGGVIERLASEADARNRLALVRLAGQLGSGTTEIAARYLADGRWYVVRNMCAVLGELADPKLVEHIAPALQHTDARVQQAALKTLIKSRSPQVPLLLSRALGTMSPQVLDEALEHLMFLKSPSAITALQDFVLDGKHGIASLMKAVQALGAIPDVAALYTLGRVVRSEQLDERIRRAALTAVASRKSEIATRLLEEIGDNCGPLAETVRQELKKRELK